MIYAHLYSYIILDKLKENENNMYIHIYICIYICDYMT